LSAPNAALLSAIADPALRELAGRGQVRSYPKSAIVINEGEPGDALYVILAGKVKVFLADEAGREVIIGHCGPGDYLGEMTLDGGPRSASVMCLEAGTFSVVSRAAVREVIAANPDFAFQLMSTVIARARLMTDMVKNLALLDVYGRVARLLLQLAVEQDDGRLVVSERLTQQNIADRVGASRDMVNRIFKDLSAGGYIRLENRQVVILRKPPARW
jgi:CRP/FNR family cyclic AMP-dependent transcriptional regulator